jgi:hypothetical protein
MKSQTIVSVSRNPLVHAALPWREITVILCLPRALHPICLSRNPPGWFVRKVCP